MMESAHFLLANTAPMSDGEFLWRLIAVLSVVGNLGFLIMQFVRRDKPQERVVSFADQFASREAFDKHERENKKEHAFLHQRISEGDHKLQAELKADITCVRDDISECRSELAAAARSNEHQNQALMRIEAKIDGKARH